MRSSRINAVKMKSATVLSPAGDPVHLLSGTTFPSLPRLCRCTTLRLLLVQVTG